jgi:hypothetical protein
MDANGTDKHSVNLPGHFLPNNEGAPNLPGSGNYIAIPNGATATYEIVSSDVQIIENVELVAAPRIPLDTENEPLQYNEKEEIYSADAFYPESPVMISENFNIRGVNAVVVGVTPFQYNPVTKQLKVYKNLKIELNHTGGNGEYGEDRLRSRFWEPIVKDAILNNDVLPVVDFNKRVQQSLNSEDEEYEYVIISPTDEAYLAWADSIRLFRNMQGIKTGIVTLEEIGGNTVNAIEDYIDDIYENWSVAPAAVLLMGDYGDDMTTNVVSPIYNSYCVSDNIFADVDEDHLPDIVFARMTANDEEQLSVMVRKFMEYEKNPPTSPDFYNHPITALGWQTERWFQICSESVGGYMKNVLGKDPVRINAVYGGNPNTDPWSTATNTATVTDYFGPNGTGYIPATPAELGGFSGGTSSDVTNAINDGAFILQHRDHGSETGWGEPDYSNNDINNLTNTDLTYIFSINCLTGKYNYGSEVFAEKFHRHTNGDDLAGALGIMAASEVSYSFVNDTYVWGMYDYMWPDFLPDYGAEFPEQRGVLPAFANVYGKHYLEQSSWPYNTDNKEVTYHLFHHHGDAYLNVYTEVPQNLTVLHDDVLVSGAPFLAVSADEDALIALSVEGELIATGTGTGDYTEIPVEFLLPGTVIDVVVTKQNYFRYQAEVLVIPPDGPYVIKNAFEVNDVAGNNNGVVDYGEDILLNVEMKNVGNEIANDVTVTLSTDNPYVTLTDATEVYGDIAAEQMVNINSAFALTVAEDIPDQEFVNFTVTATDGTDEWTSYIKFHLNAPEIEILGMEIVEVSGNGNGYFDPGETGEVTIQLTNTGHAQAVEVLSTLATSSPFCDIPANTANFSTLDVEEILTATFIVQMDPATPVGNAVILMNDVAAGPYTAYKEFTTKVGLIFEDWESGGFETFEWQNNADYPWEIVTDVVYEGENALRSGSIDHNQNSIIEIDYSSMGNDSISFFRKVSSEGNYDYLKFYIDDNMVGSWSGEQDWAREVYFVPEGEHNFKWEYMKDGSASNGSDCAWIDFVVFPPMLSTTAYAGADQFICSGNDVSLNANATYFENTVWTTSGSGNFEDENALNTNYYPSEEDYAAGIVSFTLTVVGVNGDILTDDLTVSFEPAVELELASTMAVCEGEDVILSPTLANYQEVEWTTDGDGTFQNTTTVNSVYTPGANDILNGSVNLTLNVTALGTCENMEEDVVITLNPLPTATLAGEFEVCEGEEISVSGSLTGTAPWNFLLKDMISGTEYDITSETADWTLPMTMTENCEFQIINITDANGCGNDGEGLVSVVVNMLPGEATATIDVETIDVHTTTESVFEGDEVEFADSYSWILAPEEAGTFVVSEREITITWNADFEGEATLVYTAENGCGSEMIEKTIEIYSTVGYSENDGVTSFEVYPNPTEGVFKIDLQLNDEETIEVSIMNVVGQQIWSKSYGQTQDVKDQINIENLAKGSYLIKVTGNNVNSIKKLIVK